MQIKRAPIKAQDYDKVVHMDQSATHWAMEHTRLSAGAMDALSTWRDLTAAKNKVVSELCKAAGLDMSRVVQARLVRDGEETFVEIAVQEEAPSGEVSPSPAEAASEVPVPAS